MFSSIRRHLSYANVVATMALVFAMGGSAIAAKHYLINSTKQINPKVLKKLKGNAGPRGATGSQGPTGVEGAKGQTGTPGLSALSPLPSGQSESGYFGVRTGNTAGYIDDVVTFPIPMAAGITENNIVYTKSDAPVKHCSGLGHAERGYLCIYSTEREGLDTPPGIFSPVAAEHVGNDLGRLGFMMEYTTKVADGFDHGSYTVTAP